MNIPFKLLRESVKVLKPSKPGDAGADARINGFKKIINEDGKKEFLKRQWESLEGKQTGEIPLQSGHTPETRDDW